MSGEAIEFPIVRRPPDDLERPLVVSSPHSGRFFPVETRAAYRAPIERLEREGDSWVDELYAAAPTLGATFVTTPYSRYVIDLNRLRDDFSPRAVAGARTSRGPGYYGDRGLFWALTGDGDDIYRVPLTRAEVERRSQRYYDPYHAALSAELTRLRDRFGFAILLDAHSMPSRGGRGPDDLRPDIVPGDLLGASCAPWLSESVATFWRSRGFTVTPNSPYRGGAIIRRHGRPDAGIHALQLEVNRSLYMDERTGDRAPGLATLRVHCTALVELLLRFDSAPSAGTHRDT